MWESDGKSSRDRSELQGQEGYAALTLLMGNIDYATQALWFSSGLGSESPSFLTTHLGHLIPSLGFITCLYADDSRTPSCSLDLSSELGPT